MTNNQTKAPFMGSRFRFYVLDENHRPVATSFEESALWLHGEDGEGNNHVVEQTALADDLMVSTVFLGHDHRFLGEGPPILFETMIFGPVGSEGRRRYCTWDEAVAGHAQAVAEARARYLGRLH